MKYHVTIAYKGAPNSDKDTLLDKIGTKCHGEWTGSGCGFGERDVTFCFKTDRSRIKFINTVRLTKKKFKVGELYEDKEL